MTKVYAVILCGGKGERFWPRSRRHLPKQFLRLFARQTLTEQTSQRVMPVCPMARQLFVVPVELARLITRLGVKRKNLILEPAGLNTAPAIGLAAVYLEQRDPGATMLVLPADHLIRDRRRFLSAVRLAAKLAQQGFLVTFGITPSRPETAYGYIHVGRRIAVRGTRAAHTALEFKEKPDLETAREYVSRGDYLWNSGMFVWRVDAILAAFREFMPKFHERLQEFSGCIGLRREKVSLAGLYRAAPSISIDHAIMEKASNVAVVKGTFDWDDVGAWPSLDRHLPHDRYGNVVDEHSIVRDSQRCIVLSDSGLLAVLGCSDLVAVRDRDVVLVAQKAAIGSIKDLLAEVRKRPGGDRYL